MRYVRYEMHEGEAKNIVPYLLEKVLAHSMEKMRNDARAILQRLCNIFPAPIIIQELQVTPSHLALNRFLLITIFPQSFSEGLTL